MLKLLLLAITISYVASASDSEWVVFKAKHKKIYLKDEDLYRRAVYEENLKTIQTHNDLFAKGKRSFYLGENQFTDLTTAEFTKMMNGFKPELAHQVDPQETSSIFSIKNISLPTTVNWVKKGYVTKVKNQGRCGSCWAFSTTGSLEGAHFKATGKLVNLSEKNLIDCSSSFGNHGCHGGLMNNAFRYIIRNQGIDTENSYPYTPEEETCRFRRSAVGATMTSYVGIRRGSEIDLQHALATVGPVSVAIDAGHVSFQQYSGGVYQEPRCSSTRLNHGVLVVGYGSESGRRYWLVKNSWGESWGIGGYIKMSRNNDNQCGIATLASYPVV